MVSFKDAHISTKLTLLCVTTSAVALVCVVVAFFVQDFSLVQRIKAEQVEAQVSALTDNVARAVMNKDWAEAGDIMARVVTPHGVLLAWIETQAGDVYPKGIDYQNTELAQGGWFFPNQQITQRIWVNGEPLAVLKIWVSYADVEARLYYLGGYSLLAFVLAIGIAFVVAQWVQRVVSKPLLSLFELSRLVVDSGNYSVRSDIRSADELGQLAKAFNQMLSHIQQRDQMMEKRVNQRTRELQKLAEDFRYRALHDTLTGLPNRALLLEEFNRAVAHANRVGKHFSVLLLDLDNFKTINDTFGHEAGDDLLKQVAQRIRSALRGEDIVCRLGGDEFVVLLEDVESEKNLYFVGKTLISAFSQDIWVINRPVSLGVSIGTSMFPQHGVTLDELKHCADVAMYRAKDLGKNQMVVFDKQLASEDKHRILLQNELRTAAKKDELELHFQPQVDTLLKVVVGCEVFLRWHHQSLGFMQPADFLASAEETGVIQQIDHFVLREACRACAQWRNQYGVHLPMSVNLSSLHFRSETIGDVVISALEEFALPPHFLTLEINDDILLNDNTGVNRVIKKLRQLGVHFSLGDFGVGNFSLDHWRNITVDSANLHRSVVKPLAKSERHQAFVRAALRFGAELDMQVVAQGVENAEQVELLERLGCHLMQGYYFTQPLHYQGFLNWLNHLSDLHLPNQDMMTPGRTSND